MLVLPEGASREKLLPLQTFRAHARKHGQQWCNFAGDRLPSNGSLFIVTGCDKTASWGIATASTASGAISVSLKFTAVGMAEGSLRPRYEWQEFGSATVRSSREDGSPRTENQCIFIRGFFVPRRKPLFTFISDKFLSFSLFGNGAGRTCRRCYGKTNGPLNIESGNAVSETREDGEDIDFTVGPSAKCGDEAFR
ncbi:hypothetical protein DFH09DRAFT_1196186 [Mycena vulgaris]|nr:hypothetical protein DFH09DRAFT_1196186 [Mycena vulgaris]